MTRREQIIKLLKDKYTIKQLAEHFKVELSEIIEDLEHIKRSIQPRKLRNIPPICKNCGFKFKERIKVKPPTKCPRCRSESISHALFYIK